MRISKINYNPSSGKTSIDFMTIEREEKDRVVHSLVSGEEPHPDFHEALEALTPEIERLAMLPDGYLDSVRGVTLHRDEDDPTVYTVTYTATKKIGDSRSPLVINTPAIEPPNRSTIEALIDQAGLFVKGRRAQQPLPGVGDSPPPKAAVPDAQKQAAPVEQPNMAAPAV